MKFKRKFQFFNNNQEAMIRVSKEKNKQ